MTKFPLLNQLRDERQRQEDEITASYKIELLRASNMISSLRDRLRSIERVLGSKMADIMAAEISSLISAKLMDIVYRACGKVRKPKPITITFSPDVIMFADPRSLESEVIRRYREQTLPKLSLLISDDLRDRTITVVDIRVPEFGFRHNIVNCE